MPSHSTKRPAKRPAKRPQPPTVAKLAYSRKEAAATLGVSMETIDRLTKRSLLHPSRACRRPLYPVADLERFLRETGGAIPA